jgi:hypothetical protein
MVGPSAASPYLTVLAPYLKPALGKCNGSVYGAYGSGFLGQILSRDRLPSRSGSGKALEIAPVKGFYRVTTYDIWDSQIPGACV